LARQDSSLDPSASLTRQRLILDRLFKVGKDSALVLTTSSATFPKAQRRRGVRMGTKFRPYLCHVNDKLASILVDLSLIDTAPDAKRPWLLWVWVYFNSPRPDGLSSSEEAPKLYAIEDRLTPSLERACGAIFPGRITTEGRRELYYFAFTRGGFEDALKSTMAMFPDYRYDFGDQSDPDWSQYRNVLFPSAEQLQRIANQDVLDSLKKEGDKLLAPRDISHWIYFQTDLSRAEFKKSAEHLGYQVNGENDDPKWEKPFGICLVKHQAMSQEEIDKTVLELFRLATVFRGEYDGWETQVITD
jgi:regulator of RNase E activity RraB